MYFFLIANFLIASRKIKFLFYQKGIMSIFEFKRLWKYDITFYQPGIPYVLAVDFLFFFLLHIYIFL